MNDEVNVLSGDETDAESVENTEVSDDNSIRELLTAEFEKSDDPSQEAENDSEQSAEDGAEAPTVEDDTPAPPQSWTEAERQAWDELPESVQHAVSRREKEFQAGLKSDAELQKVIAPLAERLAGSGTHVDQYIENLLRADQMMNTNPQAVVDHLVAKYGLQTQSQQNPSDTASSGQSDEIAQLRAEMAFQNQVNIETQNWNSLLAANPDAEQLKEVIVGQLSADPSLSIQQGYEKAKALVSGLAQGNAAAAEVAEINAKTKAAEKANRLNLPKGKTGNVAPPASTGNLRDDITQAARQHGVKLS